MLGNVRLVAGSAGGGAAATDADKAGYWDVDAIVASDERVRVEMRFGARALGYLSGGSGNDLHAGDKVELPLWLAAALAQQGMATARAPPFFRRNEVINDAAALDLRSSSPNYYEVGATIAPMVRGEMRREVLSKVHQVLRERLLNVMDVAQNPHGQDESEFTDRLTNLERRAYGSGLDVAHELGRWKRRELVRIESDKPTGSASKRPRRRW